MEQHKVEAFNDDLREEGVESLAPEELEALHWWLVFFDCQGHDLVSFLFEHSVSDGRDLFVNDLGVQRAQIEDQDVEELHDVVLLGVEVQQDVVLNQIGELLMAAARHRRLVAVLQGLALRLGFRLDEVHDFKKYLSVLFEWILLEGSRWRRGFSFAV